MKLITEINEDIEYIIEDINGKKNLFINGVFMMSETKNRNGRIYPKDILFNEVNRYRLNYVDKKRAFGELGHPEGPTINLERVSHMVTELKEDGKNIIGKAKIMDTPYGNIVKKGGSVPSNNTQVKYAMIKSNELSFAVGVMSSLRSVPRSWYYNWKNRPFSDKDQAN